MKTQNFQLKIDSPCIDAGLDVDLSVDFTGNPVPQKAEVDIGVFEYKSIYPPTNLEIR